MAEQKVIYQFDRADYDHLVRVQAEFTALSKAVDELRNGTDSTKEPDKFIAYCKVTHLFTAAHNRLIKAVFADLKAAEDGDA